MTNFVTNLPHLIMAIVVIAAASVLGATGTIGGDTTVALIGAAGGFSLGAAAGVAGTQPATSGTAEPVVTAAPSTPTTTPTVTPPAA